MTLGKHLRGSGSRQMPLSGRVPDGPQHPSMAIRRAAYGFVRRRRPTVKPFVGPRGSVQTGLRSSALDPGNRIGYIHPKD